MDEKGGRKECSWLLAGLGSLGKEKRELEMGREEIRGDEWIGRWCVRSKRVGRGGQRENAGRVGVGVGVGVRCSFGASEGPRLAGLAGLLDCWPGFESRGTMQMGVPG